ncbi:MAG TPA: Mut7-C RNAse domain-containing protein, partial [Gemmatimonadaceae bacterium]|nr:Mut7-C RNAse domain-containing protein [Gemmatimonadaceae bacterium]
MSGWQERGAAPGPAPRFLADAMLERLARWLRVLGFDTAGAAGPDRALARRAAAEGRILLTRDRRLAAEAEGSGAEALLIRGDAPLAQLVDLLDRLGLAPAAEP